jgi:hypothetical protein
VSWDLGGFPVNAECRVMNRFVLSLSGLPFGRSLKVGTRDIASDWRHWSWTERIIAVLTALFLLSAPVLIGRSI